MIHRTLVSLFLAAGLFPFSVATTLALGPGPSVSVHQWEFDQDGDTEGWGDLRDALATPQVRGGTLQTEITGSDPWMALIPPQVISAKSCYRAVIKYRISSPDNTAQIMWQTRQNPSFGQAGQWKDFHIVADGTWQVATVDLSRFPSWSGEVLGLRLDPAKNAIQGSVEIDYVRLEG